ncbi:MAG TPA: response regulator [Dongiaceae bacterium]|nr:response regulator [Dongiaceae bacterium]
MQVPNAAYSILVVEDEFLLAAALSAALEDAGYQVTCAANGREGLDQALLSPPDLIITDFMMPRMNGINMIERLRAAGLQLPIILLTAVPKENLPNAARYDVVIGKPYDEQNLLHAVQTLIHAPEAR